MIRKLFSSSLRSKEALIKYFTVRAEPVEAQCRCGRRFDRLNANGLVQWFAKRKPMHRGLLSLAACAGILLSASALSQQRPECDAANTPAMIEGTVTAVSSDRITVRMADGSTHEFQVGKETASSYKVGDHIKARLRSNPKCDK